jgi:N-acetylneuraminic acid mutarotase
MKFSILLLASLVFSSFTIAQTWHDFKTVNSCTPRHECSLTAVGEQIILLGGRGVKPVEILDLKTQTWKKGKESPFEIHHFQAVQYKGEVFVMNAMTGNYPHEKPLEKILIYSPKTNSWREGASIPENRRRGAGGVFVYEDKIYMICGITDGHYDGHSSWFDQYDPVSDVWRTLPDAPHARDHVGAAVIGHKVYVAGGRRSSAKTNQVLQLTSSALDIFDFETGKWAELDSSTHIPTMRAGAGILAVGSEIWVLGGESGVQVPAHSEVEALDIKTLKWSTKPALLKGRHGTSAVKIAKKVYIIAGSANRGGGPELNSIEVYE